MIETIVESIRVSLVTQARVVILKEVDGDRHLPIWIFHGAKDDLVPPRDDRLTYAALKAAGAL